MRNQGETDDTVERALQFTDVVGDFLCDQADYIVNIIVTSRFWFSAFFIRIATRVS